MKAESFRQKDEAELIKQAREIEENLFRIRFQMAMGQADGLKKYREIKKDRARILTVLNQKQAGSGAAAKSTGKAK